MGFSYQHNDSRAQKVALRRIILAGRRSLAPVTRRAADTAIVAEALSQAQTHRERLGRTVTVAAYFPLSDEPGAGLADRLVDDGHRVLLPVLLTDGDLDWGVYTGRTAPGPGRLTEPLEPHLGPDAIAEADLVLVPALAVGADGTRLGRGGGSYDRALARVAPERPVMALLYVGEWPREVTAQPHDRPVTGVITPDGSATVSQ